MLALRDCLSKQLTGRCYFCLFASPSVCSAESAMHMGRLGVCEARGSCRDFASRTAAACVGLGGALGFSWVRAVHAGVGLEVLCRPLKAALALLGGSIGALQVDDEALSETQTVEQGSKNKHGYELKNPKEARPHVLHARVLGGGPKHRTHFKMIFQTAKQNESGPRRLPRQSLPHRCENPSELPRSRP